MDVWKQKNRPAGGLNDSMGSKGERNTRKLGLRY